MIQNVGSDCSFNLCKFYEKTTHIILDYLLYLLISVITVYIQKQ